MEKLGWLKVNQNFAIDKFPADYIFMDEAKNRLLIKKPNHLEKPIEDREVVFIGNYGIYELDKL